MLLVRSDGFSFRSFRFEMVKCKPPSSPCTLRVDRRGLTARGWCIWFTTSLRQRQWKGGEIRPMWKRSHAMPCFAMCSLLPYGIAHTNVLGRVRFLAGGKGLPLAGGGVHIRIMHVCMYACSLIIHILGYGNGNGMAWIWGGVVWGMDYGITGWVFSPFVSILLANVSHVWPHMQVCRIHYGWGAKHTQLSR